MQTLTRVAVALGLGVLSGGSGALALNAQDAHASAVKDTESISAAPRADAEMPFRVDFSPVGVRSESGRERLDIDLLMTSRHKKAIGVKYSSFVADERGRLMKGVRAGLAMPAVRLLF